VLLTLGEQHSVAELSIEQGGTAAGKREAETRRARPALCRDSISLVYFENITSIDVVKTPVHTPCQCDTGVSGYVIVKGPRPAEIGDGGRCWRIRLSLRVDPAQRTLRWCFTCTASASY